VHVHQAELAAFATGLYHGVFADELAGKDAWRLQSGDYDVAPGVRALCTPGHTAGHMSLFVELAKGRPVLLCGDAADLMENLTEEIAPGYCWQEDEALALRSIRSLKAIGRETDAELWPNHDLAFFRSLPPFPAWRE
jgi:N-acyl homoserine lactone hydrolase